jgi:peptide/nickel transport system permease protein
MLMGVLKALLTIWAVATMTFFLVRLMPGNPIEQYIGQLIAQISSLISEARDMPSPSPSTSMQRSRCSTSASSGSCHAATSGCLSSRKGPGLDIILTFLPWTSSWLACRCSSVLASASCLGLMAYWRDSVLDYGLTTIGSLLHSIPNYLIAIILIIFLGVRWEILPVGEGDHVAGDPPGFRTTFSQRTFQCAAILTYVVTTSATWTLHKDEGLDHGDPRRTTSTSARRGATGRCIRTAYVGRTPSCRCSPS